MCSSCSRYNCANAVEEVPQGCRLAIFTGQEAISTYTTTRKQMINDLMRPIKEESDRMYKINERLVIDKVDAILSKKYLRDYMIIIM